MKKILALVVSLALIICLFWQDWCNIADRTDEEVASVIEFFQNDYSKHDVFEDLNSKKYFVNETFLLKEFAEDLGYFEIKFPKKSETILILRRGPKKIIVDQNESIILQIAGDKFEDGLTVKTFPETGEFFIDYGKTLGSHKVNEETIFEITSALIHLRESKSLMDMALRNRADGERYMEDPSILKSFS